MQGREVSWGGHGGTAPIHARWMRSLAVCSKPIGQPRFAMVMDFSRLNLLLQLTQLVSRSQLFKRRSNTYSEGISVG